MSTEGTIFSKSYGGRLLEKKMVLLLYVIYYMYFDSFWHLYRSRGWEQSSRKYFIEETSHTVLPYVLPSEKLTTVIIGLFGKITKARTKNLVFGLSRNVIRVGKVSQKFSKNGLPKILI